MRYKKLYLFGILSASILLIFSSISSRAVAEDVTLKLDDITKFKTSSKDISMTEEDGATIIPFDQTDDGNTETGFGSGTKTRTVWADDSYDGALTIDPQEYSALPDKQADGWVGSIMGNNIYLLHMDEIVPGVWGPERPGTPNTSAGGYYAITYHGIAPVEGKLKNAMRLEQKQYMSLPASSTFTAADQITVMTWWKANGPSVGGYQVIVQAAFDVFLAVIDEAGENYAKVFGQITNCDYNGKETERTIAKSDGSVERIPIDPVNDCSGIDSRTRGRNLFEPEGVNPLDGQWHHIAMTYDGTAGGAHDIILYVDGIASEPKKVLSNVAGSQGNGIGKHGEGAYLGMFNGAVFANSDVDEFAIFNKALVATDIRKIYERQKTLFPEATFESRIMDAENVDASWNALSWMTERPNGRELPDNQGKETAYDAGNADMSGNAILLHMNAIHTIDGYQKVLDSSGSGYDGNITGEETAQVGIDLGKFGNGLKFGEGGRFVEIQNSPSLNIGEGDFSIEFWAYPTAYPPDGSFYNLISKGTTKGYSVKWWRKGVVGVFKTEIGDGDEGYLFSKESGAYISNKWHHVVVSFNRGDGKGVFYVNGRKVGEATFGSGGNIIDVSNLKIAGDGFQGTIDEVALYNRALTETEIVDHYIRGVTNVKFQGHSCNLRTCEGFGFMGPDGINSYYESYSANQLLPFVNLDFADQQFFQYKAYLETTDADYLPKLRLVTTLPDHYKAGIHTIENGEGVVAFGALSSFQTTPANEDIKYQISNDGSNWYFYDGSKWVVAQDETDTNTATQINANASKFVYDVAPGTFYFKAFLQVSGDKAPYLKEVKLGYSSKWSVEVDPGPNRIAVVGKSVVLDRTRTKATNPSYSWTIIGRGTLTNEDSPNPIYKAPNDVIKEELVTLIVTVIDPDKGEKTANLTIRLLPQVKPIVADGTIVGELDGKLLRSKKKDTLSFESVEIKLPAGVKDYALALTPDQKVIVGIPDANDEIGAAYVVEDPVDKWSGSIVLSESATPTDELVTMTGNNVSDRFGGYVAASAKQWFVVAPHESANGKVYIYNSTKVKGKNELKRVLVGSESYRLYSIAVANILSTLGGPTGIVLGPDNPAQNPNLSSKNVEKYSTPHIIILTDTQAYNDSEGTGVDRIAAGSSLIAATISADSQFRAMAVFDATGDGNPDVLGADDGHVHIFAGPFRPGAYDLTKEACRIDATNVSAIAGGDFDGNGTNDIIIATPDGGKEFSGAIHVVLDGCSVVNPVDVATSPNVMTLVGSAGDVIGRQMVVADVKGDGFATIFTKVASGDVVSFDFKMRSFEAAKVEGETGEKKDTGGTDKGGTDQTGTDEKEGDQKVKETPGPTSTGVKSVGGCSLIIH